MKKISIDFMKGAPLLNIIAAICLLFLSVYGIMLYIGINGLRKENNAQIVSFRKYFPDMPLDGSLQSAGAEVRVLERAVSGMADFFDGQGIEVKRGYDAGIYFVEELDQINAYLKEKADSRKTVYPSLGFKDMIPSETEAVPLLKQLAVMKNIVSRGMDIGVSFLAVNPLGVEEIKETAGIKKTLTQIEISAAPQSMAELVILLNRLDPAVVPESFSLQSDNSGLKAKLLFSSFSIERNVLLASDKRQNTGKSGVFNRLVLKSAAIDDRDAAVIRANNPFVSSSWGQALADSDQAAAKVKSDGPRFYYRGKALSRGREMVVLYDAVKKSTLFLGLLDQVDNLKLKSFSQDQAVFLNILNNQEIIIKREEKK